MLRRRKDRVVPGAGWMEVQGSSSISADVAVEAGVFGLVSWVAWD